MLKTKNKFYKFLKVSPPLVGKVFPPAGSKVSPLVGGDSLRIEVSPPAESKVSPLVGGDSFRFLRLGFFLAPLEAGRQRQLPRLWRGLLMGLVLISWLLIFAPNADAGFIMQRPLHIGLTNGLVGYWSFDAMTHGTSSVSDLSGNSNTGFLTNGPTKAIGKLGQALSFDGVNDYVDVGKVSPEAGSQQTVSLWAKTSTSGEIFISHGAAVTAGFYLHGLTATSLKWELNTNGVNFTNYFTSGSIAAHDGSWHHYALTNNAGTVTVYFDGASIAYTTTSGGSGFSGTINANAAENFLIGNYVQAGFNFNGLLDDVRIYNRALSPEEVRRLYHQGATTKFNASQKDRLTNGLVGYWSFDAMNMGTTSATDISGQNNTGHLINGPVKAIGKLGQALSFDGSNDYVSVGGSSSINDLAFRTVAVWVKLNNTIAADNGVLAKLSSGDSGWKLVVSYNSEDGFNNNSIGYRQSYNLSGGRWSTPVDSVKVGIWQHVVMVHDTTSLNAPAIYINGLSQVISTNTSPSGPIVGEDGQPLRIGARGVTPGNFFNGPLDEVRVYNRALSPEEVRRLYHQGATTKFNASQKDRLTNGLVGYWSFDGPDMADVTAYDRSGQNNTGTLTNGPVRTIGKLGQALSFDGSDDYVDAGSASSLDNIRTITISAWIYPRSYGESTLGVITDKDNGGATVGPRLILCQTTGNCGGGISNSFSFAQGFTTTNGIWAAPSNSITLNQWTHMAVTYTVTSSSDDPVLYKNGVAVVTTETVMPSGSLGDDSTRNLTIGSRADTTLTFDGLIDEVRIYNRALSPEEVRRLYNMGR